MDKFIIVNATALDQSGALSIVKQFVENIPENAINWLIFVSDRILLEGDRLNVRIEPIAKVKPMHKRFWWDVVGLNKWLKQKGIEPIACVSLQNTGFHVYKKHIPHFIYYHQSIPFFPYSWNPLKAEQRSLWFYKHIYPIFVKLFLKKDTKIFVQLDFIKEGFAKKFHHPINNIEIFFPSVVKPKTDLSIALSDNYLNLFYPATSFFYKNHKVVREAASKLEMNVKFYFTLPKDGSFGCIECIGTIPYEQVCSMYRACDALVFPSYIETFGLPLIEAAMTGLPILVSDLPYAREVLYGYEGAVFVKYNNSDAWTKAIGNLKKGKRFRPLDVSQRPSWRELFESILSTI